MKTKILFLILFITAAAVNLFAQTEVNRDTMLVAARDIISQTTYCGLVESNQFISPLFGDLKGLPPLLYLAETAKWGNLLAIIGYVFLGIMILVSLVMIIGFSQMSEQVGFPMWILGIVYLVFAGLYYIPVTYLYRFSDQMKLAVKRHDEKLYTSGFANLKSLFKFFGIFTIAMLVLYGVALVVIIPLSIFLK